MSLLHIFLLPSCHLPDKAGWWKAFYLVVSHYQVWLSLIFLHLLLPAPQPACQRKGRRRRRRKERRESLVESVHMTATASIQRGETTLSQSVWEAAESWQHFTHDHANITDSDLSFPGLTRHPTSGGRYHCMRTRRGFMPAWTHKQHSCLFLSHCWPSGRNNIHGAFRSTAPSQNKCSPAWKTSFMHQHTLKRHISRNLNAPFPHQHTAVKTNMQRGLNSVKMSEV